MSASAPSRSRPACGAPGAGARSKALSSPQPFQSAAATHPAVSPGGPSGLVKLLAVLVAAGAGAGAGFAAHTLAPPFPPLASEPAPPAEASAPVSTAAAPSASAPPVASAAAPPAVDPLVCMRGLFPDKTFPTDETPLQFVCAEPSPVKGGPRVRATLVEVSAKATSPGMKEWAVLGFYELAAFAVLRGKCCPASALELPASPPDCESMQTSLESVAAAASAEATQEAVDKALDSYAKAVRCVVRNKMSKVFGEHASLGGGEATTFKKILARARGEQPPK